LGKYNQPRLKQKNGFKQFVRTMDGLDLTNSTFLLSLVIGAVALAAISGAFQMYTGDEEEGPRTVKPKAVVRDGILGAIFTAMAWTLVPDSMKSMTESLGSTVSAAAANTVGGSVPDFDLQVGPARF
jgi:hypothetical protein